LAAGLVEVTRAAARRGVVPATGAADEVVTAPAKLVELGVCRGELGGDIGRRVAFERLKFGEEPYAAGVGIFGQGAGGRVEAHGCGGAGNPLLVAVERPVVGDVFDGLAEVVGDSVHDARAAGAGHGQ
jgi:hypothetical protein